jgi:hypothetical protein
MVISAETLFRFFSERKILQELAFAAFSIGLQTPVAACKNFPIFFFRKNIQKAKRVKNAKVEKILMRFEKAKALAK